MWLGSALVAAVCFALWGVSFSPSVAGTGDSVGSAPASLCHADLGSELTSLTGEDDEAESVSLSLSFPFGGSLHSSLFVGDNGVVTLGGPGEAEDFPSSDEFAASSAPVIAPFWTDLSLAGQGRVFANELTDRVVVTWQGVGSNQNEQASFTFQLQLHESGQIVFCYAGIAGLGRDDVDETVHVGLGPGGQAQLPDELDYTADLPFVIAANTALERFVVGDAFDLDGASLVFTPQPAGGYLIAIPEPSGAALGLAALLSLTLLARRRASPRQGGEPRMMMRSGLRGALPLSVVALAVAWMPSFATADQELVVRTASLHLRTLETDKLKIKGTLEGLSLEGVPGVALELGSFALSLPIEAFRVADGKFVFESETSPISKLVLDPDTDRFIAVGRDLLLNDASNPAQLRLTVGAAEYCSMLLFDELAGRWRFAEDTNEQQGCGLPEAPLAAPGGLALDTPTEVQVSIEVPEDSAVDRSSLSLVEVDPSLAPIGQPLCQPVDDGDVASGDDLTDDGIYSCLVTLEEDAPRELRLAVQGLVAGSNVFSPMLLVEAFALPTIGEIEADLAAANDAIAAWEEALARLGDPAAAATEAVAAITALPGVVEAGLTYDDSAIWLVLATGIEGTIPLFPIEEDPEDAAGAGSIALGRPAPDGRRSGAPSPLVRATASGRTGIDGPVASVGDHSFVRFDVSSVQPAPTATGVSRRDDWIGDATIRQIDLMDDSIDGFASLEPVVRDSACRSFLVVAKSFPDYQDAIRELRFAFELGGGALFIESVGVVSRQREIQLYLNELVTPTRVVEYMLEILTGELKIGWVGASRRWVFVVQPNFILTLPGRFDRTLVVVRASNSSANESFARAFRRKGAKAYFGFDRRVDYDFANGAVEQFFRHLTTPTAPGADAMTVAAAYRAVDPWIDPKPPNGRFLGAGDPALHYHCTNLTHTVAHIAISTFNTTLWQYPDGSSEFQQRNGFEDLSALVEVGGPQFTAHYVETDDGVKRKIDIDQIRVDDNAENVTRLTATWILEDELGLKERTHIDAATRANPIPLDTDGSTGSVLYFELEGAAVCKALDTFEYSLEAQGPVTVTLIPPVECNAESRLSVRLSGAE